MKTIIKRVKNYKIVNYIRNTFFENFCIFFKKNILRNKGKKDDKSCLSLQYLQFKDNEKSIIFLLCIVSL